MKLLVTGAAGQVGSALVRLARAAGHDVAAPARQDLDITDGAAVDEAVAAVAGGAVVNAAAYTAVDRAESEPDRAFAVNRRGAENLAAACAARGVHMIHVSTDLVFDGAKPGVYDVDDPVSPLGVYGRSKAEGEAAVAAALPGAAIVRTSWVFSAGGAPQRTVVQEPGSRPSGGSPAGTNFVTAIVRQACERAALRVVADQRGCPTFAGDLAGALLALAARPDARGLYHFCGPDEISRHAFAEVIVAAARARGAIAAGRVEPIATGDHPAAARRPARVVLDTSRIRALGIEPRPWRAGLDEVMDALFAA